MYRSLDLNRHLLVLEATTLPTEPLHTDSASFFNNQIADSLYIYKAILTNAI